MGSTLVSLNHTLNAEPTPEKRGQKGQKRKRAKARDAYPPPAAGQSGQPKQAKADATMLPGRHPPTPRPAGPRARRARATAASIAVRLGAPSSLNASSPRAAAALLRSSRLRRRGRGRVPRVECGRRGVGARAAPRFAADFYITDAKSGKIALVKAGHNSKVVPLVDENILVATSRDTELSSTLKYWLEERNLSSEEAQLIRLEEGYIREGMRLSVIGILSKKDGDAMILPPPEPISTGCVFRSCLLPTYFDGIVLRFMDRSYFVPNSGVS
ncbi:hypothetical protein PR202_ga19519 [Eleusine coracana subsp. coracana]|uniref:Uncharacterized protein n=1 Tax=Eleusine coracana subsp. coracana TaxID=191504 RepID=A0AAV5CVC6_ELECO|nr:hypothetical protein PR202_ga19519 [Eleusine coracana subsp. coracana]